MMKVAETSIRVLRALIQWCPKDMEEKIPTRRQLWPCAFREYPTKENPNAFEYSE
jgi:hypothetical protein